MIFLSFSFLILILILIIIFVFENCNILFYMVISRNSNIGFSIPLEYSVKNLIYPILCFVFYIMSKVSYIKVNVRIYTIRIYVCIYLVCVLFVSLNPPVYYNMFVVLLEYYLQFESNINSGPM